MIKDYASKGGRARSASLNQARRIEIARNAAITRHKQAQASTRPSAPGQDEGLSLVTKYGILVSFLRSKDVDINDLFEEYISHQNSE